MDLTNRPDFIELARTSIAIFHPEVLNFPDDVIEKAVEFKAAKLEQSYETMLKERRQ